MKTVLLTGSTSGIGKEIKSLLKIYNYKVIELNRNSGDYQCDLSKPENIQNVLNNIENLKEVSVLINCAGIGYYGLHENLKSTQISEMVRVNFEAPMILCNELLPYLKANKGCIINISSITAEQINTHGCAYGATKAGITSFTKSLFAEVRKHGLRCVNIEPDMTETNLYRNANFTTSDDPETYLTASEVAKTVLYCIENQHITSITLQPQKHQIKRK